MSRPGRPGACSIRDEAALEMALRQAFWRALGQHPMDVMAALETAARTVGSLYRDVAAAHEGPGGCACGWEPEPEADLIVLEAHLAASLLRAPERAPEGPADLARLPTAGRA